MVEGGADDAVVEGPVDLGQRVRELVEVRDPADDRGEVDDVRAALGRRPRLVQLAQVARVDLAALAHPLRRQPLVGDADLPGGVAQQAADDGRADRAGAAGDEHPPHARSAATSDAYAKTWAAPNAFQGSTTRQSGAASSAMAARESGVE